MVNRETVGQKTVDSRQSAKQGSGGGLHGASGGKIAQGLPGPSACKNRLDRKTGWLSKGTGEGCRQAKRTMG